ncbi:unnamed protein product [Paramecium sonneborni]|uniref:Uncharacterized protein n=1 Tax=Paramecium sonneborni TaxID=65129 RepID=A0A8S1QL63_9CILI|nr:unnamed protein product [Paramecium sonneborni]
MNICRNALQTSPQERLTTAHIDQHIKRYRFAQKYKRVNRFVVDPHMHQGGHNINVDFIKGARKSIINGSQKIWICKNKKRFETFFFRVNKLNKLSRQSIKKMKKKNDYPIEILFIYFRIQKKSNENKHNIYENLLLKACNSCQKHKIKIICVLNVKEFKKI